ncbi:MAG: Crp/Fnr family transcriptional regulator [Candidatus Thiothrix putei]|uniref:Crp/Fnr family transcriptional regulator n=1 Tax=Candidatus Thiothrix putei TaxID=3080811 RepID=A0AA95HIM9_9GAMM|nr:MAG: Crp/Fnr family transcriptional regulator [Candidatus Thiothrix putei]
MSGLSAFRFAEAFPFLAVLGEEACASFQPHIGFASIPAGQHVCREGDICPQLAIVLSGSVRVYKVGENGREITLYRIGRNDSCILTASCILSQTRFPALAVVEQAVQVAVIPAVRLREWVAQHEVWRGYVFGLMSQRLADVITTLNEVVFRRVDVRLAEYLLKLDAQQVQLAVTHQELASELGTAREVVSRILKDFERENLLALSRGTLTVQDRAGLQRKVQIL